MDEKEFRDYLSSLTAADKVLSAPVRKTLRINTLKISKKEFFEITKMWLEPTFYEDAFYAEAKGEDGSSVPLGATWEYFLGYIHVQSLSSMLPSLILNPAEDDLVLDAAASPGSKTTHMAMLMKNKGAILAIDRSMDKCGILFSNIARLGVLNTKVGVRDGRNVNIKNYFTKALLDAPCTALSHPAAIKRFTLSTAEYMSHNQKKMIISVYDSLMLGGELVYSTCTYSTEENEAVVKYLLEERPGSSLVPLGIEFPHDSGLSEFGKEFRNTARIYPYHFNSEGFFIAKIIKGE